MLVFSFIILELGQNQNDAHSVSMTAWAWMRVRDERVRLAHNMRICIVAVRAQSVPCAA